MTTPKTLTTEECEKLLFALWSRSIENPSPPKNVRNYTIALLMLDAGLRVGEVVKLRVTDLYFNSQPVTSIIIRPEIAKNKAERIIPISQRLSNAIKNMFECYWTDYPVIPSDFVFVVPNSNDHITTRQVERIIRAAAMKSLGRPVHPHVLRHTFASRLMRTVSIRVVQELLGHKSLTSTQIYTHPNHEDLKKAIETIDNVHSTLSGHAESRTSATDTPDRPDTTGTDRNMR